MNRGSMFAVGGALGVLVAVMATGCAGESGEEMKLPERHQPAIPVPGAAIPGTNAPGASATPGMPERIGSGTVPGGSGSVAAVDPTAPVATPPTNGGAAANNAASHCKTEPMLHVTGARGLFCPFSKGADGKFESCAVGKQACCVSARRGGTPSKCTDLGAACETAHFALGCADSPSCGASEVCCATGPTPAVAACTYPESRHLAGSSCMKTCAAGQYQLCSSDADCGSTGKCSAYRVSGMQFGYCHP